MTLKWRTCCLCDSDGAKVTGPCSHRSHQCWVTSCSRNNPHVSQETPHRHLRYLSTETSEDRHKLAKLYWCRTVSFLICVNANLYTCPKESPSLCYSSFVPMICRFHNYLSLICPHQKARVSCHHGGERPYRQSAYSVLGTAAPPCHILSSVWCSVK